jgi:hypothetical protein
MGRIRFAFIFIALLASLNPTLAAERKLLTLGGSDKTAVLTVLDVPELQRLQPPIELARWTVRPAAPIRGNTRPPDRLVELYTGTPQAPSLLCRLLIRYYSARAGWVPHFQLIEEPVVARTGDRLRPFDLAQGAAGLLVQHGGTLPNAEGFFPTLEFGPSAGGLALVGWQVR